MSVRELDLVDAIESELLRSLPRGRLDNRFLNQALRDAVFLGGKRLRPILCVLGAQVFGKSGSTVLEAACAVEFVHTSSLIIDDLPCMDDAQLRRGNPALHLVYGQDISLLAGIALLNQAFSIFGRVPELIREATECIGLDGMVGGQAIDLRIGADETSLDERNRKTSALIRLALTAGALSCGISPQEVAPLAAAGHCLGQAYQVYDDLRDSGGASEFSGKTAGQDLRHKRPSHMAGANIESSYSVLVEMLQEARCHLTEAYGREGGVASLIDFIDRTFASQVQEGARKRLTAGLAH